MSTRRYAIKLRYGECLAHPIGGSEPATWKSRRGAQRALDRMPPWMHTGSKVVRVVVSEANGRILFVE